jgi:hypothetical protein
MNVNKPLAAAMGLGLLLASTGASAQWTGFIGGSGGSPYEFNCGGGIPVTSFGVRAGWHIDALQARCWNGNTSPYFGGSGGSFKQLSCALPGDSNRAMRGIELYSGWVINAVQGFCESMASSGVNWTDWAGDPTNDVRPRGTYSSLRCAQYDWIERIRGGSGIYLDRISVYCQ